MGQDKGQQRKKQAEDLLRRWGAAQAYSLEHTTPAKCVMPQCVTEPFKTGDVVFLYGNLDGPALERVHHLCARCGMVKAFDNIPPSATLLYVEPEHLKMGMAKLPEDVRKVVVQGFVIIDKIHKGVEENLARILVEQREARGGGGEPN